jgi:hypothetical protein
MTKASKRIVSSKTLRKAFRKHPYTSVAAAIALGGVATVLGRSERARQLGESAVRKLTTARAKVRGALHTPDESNVQHH